MALYLTQTEVRKYYLHTNCVFIAYVHWLVTNSIWDSSHVATNVLHLCKWPLLKD